MIQELSRIRRQRLHVASLALGIDGVKGQRRLPRPAEPGNHGEGIARDFDVYILEVMLPRPPHRNLRNRHEIGES